MNLAIAAAIGGGIFFLTRKPAAGGAKVAAAKPEDQHDPKATLSGPDGSQSTASAGAPPVAFNATGGKSVNVAVNTAPNAPKPAGKSGAAPKPAGTPAKPLTVKLQPKKPPAKNGAGETQTSIKAAINGLAPGLLL